MITNPLQKIVARLEACGCEPRSCGTDQYEAKCPSHHGERRNLSIGLGQNGDGILHCHHIDENGNATCTYESILEALGLTEADLFANTNGQLNGAPTATATKKARPKTPPKTKHVYRSAEDAEASLASSKLGPITGRWPYPDAEGFEVARVLRFDPPNEPKQYRPIHPEADGWVVGDPAGLWPLYGLRYVLASERVFCVEGEKVADLALGWGLTATTSAHGAQSPRKTDWRPLAGKNVIIVPDHGSAGAGYSKLVRDQLDKLNPRPTVRVLNLPGLKDSEDLEQWVLTLPEGAVPRAMLELLLLKVEPEKPDRPTIIVGNEDKTEGFKTWTPAALEAIAATNDPPTLFQRAGKLVRLTAGDKDAPPGIAPLGEEAVRGVVDRAAYWGTIGKSGTVKYGPPRKDIAQDILTLGQWDDAGIPHIEMVVEIPRFLENGTLLVTPGYNRSARLYYAPIPEVRGLTISLNPTSTEIAQACSLLLDELFGDFIFGNQGSRANTLALTLLPFVRLMIAGPTPLHHIGATTEGTGKTLLATLCAYPSLGREISTNSQKETESEWRKSLTSTMLSGQTIHLTDNLANIPDWQGIPEVVDSGVLAAVLTAYPFWSDRVLGKSTIVSPRNMIVWISTGNSTVFSREINRRMVPTDLVSLTENPSLRTGFRHDPIESWVEANRLELLKACLTLVQAWIAAGQPQGSEVMGKFERYAKIMGGILQVIGVPGFLTNRQRLFAQNSEASRWNTLVEAWADRHSTALVATSDIWELIQRFDELNIAFIDVLSDGKPIAQKQRLGHALDRLTGQVWGKWRIIKSTAKIRGKGSCYRLVASSQPYNVGNGDVEDEGDAEEVREMVATRGAGIDWRPEDDAGDEEEEEIRADIQWRPEDEPAF